MKPLSPGAERALRAYRRVHGVPPAVRARLIERLEQASGPAQASSASSRPGRGLRLLRWGGPLALLIVGLGFSLRPQAPALDGVPLAEQPATAPLASAPTPTGASSAPAQASQPPSPAAIKRARDERPALRGTLRKVAKRSSSSFEPMPAPTARAVASPDTQAVAIDTQPQRPEGASLSAEPSAREPVAAQARHAWQGVGASLQERQPTADAPRPALSLDDEVMLLRRVSEHLTRGDPLRALSALSEHARLFPDGKLVTMRQAARVRALCELGKRAEAEREAAQFLAAHADSPYAAQVRGGCQR